MGILENVLIQMSKFIISFNFMVMDTDDSSQVPIILRRSFLATIGAVVDVHVEKLYFQLSREKIDFYFLPSTTLLLKAPIVP